MGNKYLSDDYYTGAGHADGLTVRKQVIDAFDKVGKDIELLQRTITDLTGKKVNEGRSR